MNKLQGKLGLLLAVLLTVPCSAVAQEEPLDALLSRTGFKVAQFLEQFADVKCSEEVLQEKLSLKGKTEEKLQSTFEYLVITQNQGAEPVLYESRETVREAHSKKNVSMLVTNGFATQLLVFHPYYQPSFSFERLPDLHLNGRSYVQVHFQHVKGRQTPAVLLLRGREYPLSLAGTARIDAKTGMVEQITTELANSMEDVGLKAFHTEVDYAATSFPGQARTYWLPAQATVEVSTAKQRWKNIHRFSNYQQFSVSVTEKVDLDKMKEKEQ